MEKLGRSADNKISALLPRTVYVYMCMHVCVYVYVYVYV